MGVMIVFEIIAIAGLLIGLGVTAIVSLLVCLDG
jgi:hypothetical protein